jgi:hypothetical protein
MEFKSQICTTLEQSERLVALGLKYETADMMLVRDFGYLLEKPLLTTISTIWVPHLFTVYNSFQGFIDGITRNLKGIDEQYVKNGYKPAWTLDRLLEIANNNSVDSFTGDNRYDDVIALIQSHIHLGYINEEYLNMDIVAERENENIKLMMNQDE